MVFRVNKWGWKATAARLLIAPLITAGAVSPVVAQGVTPPIQSSAPAAVSKSGTPSGQPAAKTSNPKELLKMGRAALKAGRFDEAQALARQADTNNPSGRWGLFDDTPESLEKDIRSARAKHNKAQSEQLVQQAKALMAQVPKLPNDAQKLAALDEAYALADRAVALAGPSGFLDNVTGVFSDKPEKIRGDIDAQRVPLRRRVPASEMAKLNRPTDSANKTASTGGPTPNSRPTPTPAPKTATNTAPKPATTPGSVNNDPKLTEAAKLLNEGRTLIKQGRVVEAKRKAAEAAAIGATFPNGSDTPETLLRDSSNEAKKQLDSLVADADKKAQAGQSDEAEAALRAAYVIATGMGFQTRPIESRQAALRGESDTPAPVESVLANNQPTGQLVEPSIPVMPASANEPKAEETPSEKAEPEKVTAVDVAPKPREVAIEPPVMKTDDTPSTATSVSSVPVLPSLPKVETIDEGPKEDKVPALPVVVGDMPAAPLALPVPEPKAPEVAADDKPQVKPENDTVPGVPMLPVVVDKPTDNKEVIERMLADAATELRQGEFETARRMASQVHQMGAKDEAQQLMRDIDAASKARKQADAAAAFRNAVDLMQAKQYENAHSVLRLLDPELLDAQQRGQLPELVNQCLDEINKVEATPRAPVVAATDPTEDDRKGSGLADQMKAMGEVEFQKLRSEGLEVETKARQAFDRGETDLAIEMLGDFVRKVKGSNLSTQRQNLLLNPVDRRLESFRIMKRQMDFYAKEAADKKEARERIVGRSLAEQEAKEEIAKKVREVNDLVKGKKFKEAEALALQLTTLEPGDPTLSALYELAKRNRRVEEYAKIKSDKEELFLGGMNAAEKQGPLVDVDNPVALNVERALVAMTRGDGSHLYTRNLSAKEREIEMRLDQPLSVDFRNMPLRDALDKVRQDAGINISIDDASLQDEVISLDKVLVSESVEDLSVRNILTLLLDKARLRYVIENDVVRVTTEKKAQGRLYTKVFNVMELVTPIPDFALADHQDLNKVLQKQSNPTPPWQMMGQGQFAGRGGLQGGELVSGGQGDSPFVPKGTGVLDNRGSGTPVGTGGSELPTRQQTSQQLMKLVTGMVRPYSWQDMGGPGKLDYYDVGGAMVVNQTADVIQEVQDLLEALRRLQDLSLTVEVRVISLSESFFERVGVDFAVNVKANRSGRDGTFFERALTTGQFRPEPFINNIDVRNTTVGWNPTQGGFTPDLNVPIRPNSFGFGIPPFGGYPGPNPNGGLSLGLAFLNDIQVFMFMEAAQGDRRVNVMQAPKITLFNGQTSTVSVGDVSFFTTSIQVFNVGGQIIYLPENTPFPLGGVNMTVQGVVSADRKFVRLTMAPSLTELTDAIVPLFPVTAFITPVFEGGSQGVPIPFTQFFQQPTFNNITVQTTVQVPDGGTVVMGGLKTLSEGRNEFGPPVLSSIPYVNRLFRNQGIGRETKHIMIMVTPRIVINSEEELRQTGQGGNMLPAPGGY